MAASSSCASTTPIAERSTEEYALGIEVDLEWLGVAPDRKFRQSERFALYDAAAKKLKEAGRLYPCYETPDELERKRRLQIARGAPPVYDRAALSLTEAERAALEAAGRKPHWRFRLEPEVVRWDDLIRGDSHIDCASLSDPVLVREDGSYLYTLPSVVDDLDAGVTHIIRGEDHVTNTAVQVQLFRALGAAAAPHFAHHNLLIGADGQGLSKRTGALSIAGLREAGVEIARRGGHGHAHRFVHRRAARPQPAGTRRPVRSRRHFPQQRALRRRGTAGALAAGAAWTSL